MSVLGLNSGYTVKYTPLPSGVPWGFALGNSFRQRGIFDQEEKTEVQNSRQELKGDTKVGVVHLRNHSRSLVAPWPRVEEENWTEESRVTQEEHLE